MVYRNIPCGVLVTLIIQHLAILLTAVPAMSKNVRKKVALKPGHSLMNWVNLCNTRKDLAGTGGTYINVNHNTLSQHNSESNAWMAINGIVYNVTEYMPFHPGGEEELMRGAGTDATKLFNEIHPWVNYESLLRCCVVGRLRRSLSLPPSHSSIQHGECSIKPNTNTDIRKSNYPIKLPSTFNKLIISKSEQPIDICKIDWYQQMNTICLLFYMKTTATALFPPKIFASLDKENLLSLSINDAKEEITLKNNVRWPCDIKIRQNNVEVRFNKKNAGLWSTYGSKCDKLQNSFPPPYCKMKVLFSATITHDTKLIAMQYIENMLYIIHVGHHVKLKETIDGEEIERAYTPVPLLIENDEKTNLNEVPLPPGALYFLVKKYKNGKLSRKLCSYTADDTIQMSAPNGSFDTKLIKNNKLELVLMAAGTGITPIISIIVWALRFTKLRIKLMFFNKTEEDIIWNSNIDKLSKRDSRFSVIHILSEASETWNGVRGFVTEKLVRSVISEDISAVFVCICGPNMFTTTCQSLLQNIGYTTMDYFCFL